MHSCTPLGRGLDTFPFGYRSRGSRAGATAAAAAIMLASGGCSHLDEIEQYNPSLAQRSGTCQTRIEAPSADQVFSATDDSDATKDGVQIEGILSYSGTHCKELRWGMCGAPLDASQRLQERDDKELVVTFTLAPGKVKLCAQAVDGRDRLGEAPRVPVEQLVCSESKPQCGADPVCRDLRSDPSHCGACGTLCPSQPHGAAACDQGVCTVVCEDGYHLDPSKAIGSRECVSRSGCAGLSTACSSADCCAWDLVAQDEGPVRFQRGYDASNVRGDLLDEWQPREDAARVSVQPFILDRYEVSVGRFRRFLDEYDDWIGGGVQPRRGYAQHPALPNSGWQEDAWNRLTLPDAMLMRDVPVVPPTAADFRARVLKCGKFSSFTEEQGDQEALPINCVSFFESFLFCMWDQGRLPTEAEWNAAATASEQRYYPWSIPPTMTGITPEHALYGKSEQLPDPVGAHPRGQGPFGSHDLAGNVYEWTRDSEVFDPACKVPNGSCSYGGDASDPIELTGDTDPFGQQYHVLRGGSYKAEASRLRTAHRYVMYGMTRISDIGFRCARPMVTN